AFPEGARYQVALVHRLPVRPCLPRADAEGREVAEVDFGQEVTFLQLSRGPSYVADPSIPAGYRRSPVRAAVFPLGPGPEPELVNSRHAGILQLARDAGLFEKATRDGRIERELFLQDLDGHLAVEDGVGGAVNDAHAAVRDLVEQMVTPRSRQSRRG